MKNDKIKIWYTDNLVDNLRELDIKEILYEREKKQCPCESDKDGFCLKCGGNTRHSCICHNVEKLIKLTDLKNSIQADIDTMKGEILRIIPKESHKEYMKTGEIEMYITQWENINDRKLIGLQAKIQFAENILKKLSDKE